MTALSTPADLLREAAWLMRERASAATGSPWCPEWTQEAVRHIARNVDIDCSQHGPVYTPDCPGWDRYNDGPYIASWHPAVAFAVADWLEVKAAHITDPDHGYALNVARAYLGGVTP